MTEKIKKIPYSKPVEYNHSSEINPLLSRDEISSLLNPDSLSIVPDISSSIVSFSALSSKSLFKLSKLFCRIAESINENIKHHAIKIWFDNTKICMLDKYMEKMQIHLFAYTRTKNVDNNCLLFFSQSAADIILTAYMGGNILNFQKNKTDYTNIELNTISLISEKIYGILSDNFNILPETDSCISTDIPSDINIEQLSVISQMSIEMDGHMGKFHIVIPYDKLETYICHHNKTSGDSEKSRKWTSYLSAKALNSEITLTAILTEKYVPVREIYSWDKGYIFPLNIAKNDEISIINKNKTILKGITGRKNNNIAIKITNKVMK